MKTQRGSTPGVATGMATLFAATATLWLAVAISSGDRLHYIVAIGFAAAAVVCYRKSRRS